MIVLGVDPGLYHTGVGLVASDGNRYRILHCEVLSLKPAFSLPEKLRGIHDFVAEIIRHYQPDVLALEDVFYGRNIQSMVKIGEARSCVMLAASENHVTVIEYAPARVKESVTGNGRASKVQVQSMIKRLLKVDQDLAADAADALAVAICHLHSQSEQNLRALKDSAPAKVVRIIGQ